MVINLNQIYSNQLPGKVTWFKNHKIAKRMIRLLNKKININQLPFGVTWLNYDTKVILYRLSAKVTTYTNQLIWREK